MNKIIPSTKLRMVSVHKLKSLPCLRKYFWRRVLNLESRNMNLNFWYGGVLAAGFEALLMGKDYKKALKVEDKKRCSRHVTTGDIEDEMRLQRRLILAYIEQAKKLPAVRKMKLNRTQASFKVRLKKSKLWFLGTPDGEGTYANVPTLFENKTAGQVNNAYIRALSFDKQVHGYGYAHRLEGKPALSQCCYCIFRKPQKHIKRGQTIDQFVEEIRLDLADPKRRSFYYIFHKFHLGRNTVSEVGEDIETLACILKDRYTTLKTESAILNPHNWPKQEDKCHDYKGCEFLQLCENPKRWKLYLRLFQQREMMYSEERKELQI